ncbi:MAG: acyl-CoA dehydrogenase, partial [Candidatus Tectomicrobia bacterium]|nr:acyl-CoA dehydrogenase [Candidatus Tectomicrobia bacterium]
RPIGSFQAIQHKCANMLVEIDAARYITYEAAWKVTAGLPASQEISMAKAWASEAHRRVCLEAHQIHAGIGFTEEHDLGLYFRRAKRAELSCGDATQHRERLAQLLEL